MHPQTSGATDGESTNSDGAKSSRSRRRKRSQHSRDADRPHSSNRAAGDDASPPAADTTKTNIEGGTQGDERLDLPKAMAILQHILNVLERTDSKIVSPLSKLDSWPLLWSRYKTLADEYDKDLVERYREDMETSSIFAGLFSAVVATVAGMTLPTLSADPNLKTQVVLQAILHSLDPTAGNLAEVASSVAWNGPSISVLWVQSLLYASLTCSLFAALGSVMGRQWLGKYSSVGEHGTLEDRCKERQRKFDALQTWHFFTVLEAIPVLLQASLLLFGLGLSAYMWSQTVVVAAVLIAMNGVGALAYFWLIKSSAQYPDCPFYSPLSSRLRSAVNSVSIIWGERSLYWGPLRKAVSTVTSPPIAVFNAYMLGPLVSGSVFLSSWLRSFHCGAAADEESVVSRPAPPTITQRLLTVLEVLLQPLRSCFSRVRGQLRHVLTPPPTIVQKLWMIVEFIRQSVRTCSSRVMDVLRQLLASDEQASSDEAMTVVAFLWLWETSTDPITRDDMMQLVPEIPRGMMADRFSLHHLDFLLDRMVECIDHGDDINGDKFLSFGRAYLVLHVELLVFRDPHDEINVGVNQAEHVSKVHLIKYKTLPFLRYSTDSGEGPNLNRLLYFTLDNFYRGLRDFDASRLLREFSIHNYDARATPTSNIYTTTLLYLGHLCASGYVSLHEYRMELDWISHIVTHCLHISERDRDHDRLLLVVLAMLLGHNHLAVTSDAQSSVEAARYILSRAENDGGSHYFWNTNVELSDQQLLDRLDSVLVILRSAVDPDSLRRGRDSLGWGAVSDLAGHWIGDTLSHQQEDECWKHPAFPRILELNVTILSPTLTGTNIPLPTHSCHLSPFTNSFLWLPAYLEVLGVAIGSIPVMDMSEQTLELWQIIANVFLLMSSSSFSPDQACVVVDGDSALINTIRWAMSVVTMQDWEGRSAVEVLGLYRLQSATLCILHSPILASLISMEHPQDNLLHNHILDLLNHLSNQKPYQYPRYVSYHLPWQKHPDVACDRTAVDIIRGLLRIEDGRRLDDLQDDEEWSADPASHSHPFLYTWIQIVCGWLYWVNPHSQELPLEMISLFSTNLLLRCKMLRQPTEPWLAALTQDRMSRHGVSVVAIAAAWSGWDAWEKSTDRSPQRRTTLIGYTVQVLNCTPETGWEDVRLLRRLRVRWYLDNMLRISGSEANREEGADELQGALEAVKDKMPKHGGRI